MMIRVSQKKSEDFTTFWADMQSSCCSMYQNRHADPLHSGSGQTSLHEFLQQRMAPVYAVDNG